MNDETAQKIIQVRLPGYRMASAPAKSDSSPLPEVEISSPRLDKLKQKFFKGRAAVAPPVKSPAPDSGILMVEKEGSRQSSPKAIIVSKGRIVGRQG